MLMLSENYCPGSKAFLFNGYAIIILFRTGMKGGVCSDKLIEF